MVETIDSVAALRARRLAGTLAGFHDDLPEAVYHGSGVGLSQTHLKHFARSPAHLAQFLADPPAPTPAMIKGRALHRLVLEGEAAFARAFAVIPRVDRRTKVGKAAYAEAVIEHADKTILDDRTMLAVRGMAEALWRSPLARAILGAADARREVSAFWPCEGILCRGRYDLVIDDVLVDVKHADDASPRAFRRAVHEQRYDWQHAHYGEGQRVLTGAPFREHLWVVVEPDPPHAVAVYRLTDEDLAQARHEVLDAVRRYAALADHDPSTWPSYPDEVLDLPIPNWLR